MAKGLKVYIYQKCSTCRNALKWLDKKGVNYETMAIRETPPSRAELKRMLGYYDGEIRKILNTSSQDYRDAKLKDRLEAMSDAEVFAMLQETGNLVKRPFVLGEDFGVVGFKEEVWKKVIK